MLYEKDKKINDPTESHEVKPHQLATSVDAGPRKSYLRIGLMSFGVLILVAIGGIVVLAISRELEEQPVDDNRTRRVEISEGSNSNDGSDDQQPIPENYIATFLSQHPMEDADHPLDPVLELARMTLSEMRENVQDYSATFIKQERIKGDLGNEEFISLKIRQSQTTDGVQRTQSKPFAAYLRFLDPPSVRGREVIWVEGQNRGRIIAHEGGWKNLGTLRLNPESALAMVGNKYPITEIGIEHLLVKLISLGEDLREEGPCTVEIDHRVAVNGRPCTRLLIRQHQRGSAIDYYQAELFIDHELRLPIRFVAYDWPNSDDAGSNELPLLEKYTYVDMQINVGLTDHDFDPENEDYRYH